MLIFSIFAILIAWPLFWDWKQGQDKPRDHSKWDLVGYSGGSPGLDNAVNRWGRPIGPICFSVYFHANP